MNTIEFKIRNVGKYVEVAVICGQTKVELGLQTVAEAEDLLGSLERAVEEFRNRLALARHYR